MDDAQVKVQVHTSLSSVSQQQWDACTDPQGSRGRRSIDPFTSHQFLSALEKSGSVGPGTGWHPRHLTVHVADQMVAVMPLYAKSHSQGEYVFDHNWAHAYEQAGGRYYPKLQAAVPFSPVTGRRFLTRNGWDTLGQAALVEAMVEIASENEVSGAHVSFCEKDEAEAGKKMGLLHRTGQQFHWLNNGYTTFDGFLANLSARKRKNIRKERRTAQSFGGEIVALTGGDIEPEHWDAMWQFYQDTGGRKWGTPYLTREFFEIVHEEMRDSILMVLAIRDGRPVAGALNVIGRDALFGRYWGCIEDHPCLHFELCYYQAIEWAIAHNLSRVEAGAQGDHKLARGYMPVETHSLHWIRDPGFREAIDSFLVQERLAVNKDIEVLTSWGPFRKSKAEDHQ